MGFLPARSSEASKVLKDFWHGTLVRPTRVDPGLEISYFTLLSAAYDHGDWKW